MITPFPDLDAVLDELVARVRGVLGANFVGAYLQGSFALGDGDAYSDVDWVIVTEDDVPEDVATRLDAMHRELHGLPSEWAQHLEGSYAPRRILRRMTGAPTEVPGRPRPQGWSDPGVSGGKATAYPFLFLGNGQKALVRSQHDNTQVVRWVLRERGIPLAGPDPKTLIDPVDPEELRAEVRAILRSFHDGIIDGSISLDTLHIQGFAVLFWCRTLQSLDTATIGSKPGAMRWAKANVDARWHSLIDRAWDDRNRYPRGHGAPTAHANLKATPADIAETIEFARYAVERA